MGFQHFRPTLHNQKPKLMAIFSSNHSLELYLPKFMGPFDFLPFFLINAFKIKVYCSGKGSKNILYSDNTLLLICGLTSSSCGELLSVCAYFKPFLVFSSNLRNVYKKNKKIKKIKKKNYKKNPKNP